MAFTDLVAQADRVAQEHLGGTAVLYQPQIGAPVSVVGIFSDNYQLADPSNLALELVGPAVWLRLEDLPIHPDEDEPKLVINDQEYTVRERQPDGVDGGSIVLLLHEVA